MKSRVARMSKSVFAVLLSAVVALSLVPLPQGAAYADEGSLAAGQGDIAGSDTGTAQTDPTQTDLAQADPAQADPAQADPAQADQVQADPVQVDPVQYSDVTIAARGKVQGSSWGSWVASGETIGAVKGKGLKALKIKLKGNQDLPGSISYQLYKRGSGWKNRVSDGKSTGSVQNAEAVRIKLTGKVAKHYDVLYRAYVSGKGWQPWVKNNAKAGVTGKKLNITAVQVKLSPKTIEAAGGSSEDVGIRYEARFKATGWQAWKGNGKTAGKSSGSKVLSGIAVKVDTGALEGAVKYRAYNKGTKWSDWKTSGFAGQTSNRLEAIAIKLTGDIAKQYDVYYRAYSQKAGWLDWAKNGKAAGSTGYNLRLQAFQVRLVRKGDAAPGLTQYPTVNLMEKSKSLNGIDIASWQAGIDIAKVKADFVIVKSTQGDWYTNPYFKEHADATLASGKLLGIYHFADLRGSATEQAKYFVKSVKPYLGKTVLFLDYEADILNIDGTVAWAKKFLNYVYKKTGVKPLIYLSKNETRDHDWSSVAKKYELWVAQYPNYNPVSGFLSDPWTDDYGYGAWSSPRMFQYTSQGYDIGGYSKNLDFNKFYGSVLSWRKLQR